MQKEKRKRYLFNFAGGCIVVFWLMMMGLLAKKTAFVPTGEPIGISTEKRSTVTTHRRDWMEIYLKGKKVGYSLRQVSPLEKGYLVQEEVFLRLNLMGRGSSVYTTTRSLLDPDLLLKNFTFKMISGVVKFGATGTVEGNRMVVEIGEGRARRHEVIELEAPPMMDSGVGLYFREKTLRVGESFRLPVFDPSTLSQREVIIKVVERESLVIGPQAYTAFRLEAEVWGQSMTFWVDEGGDVLKEQGLMGLTLVRSGAGRALRDLEAEGGEDFYELASIKTRRPLREPARITYLKLKVDGLDEAHLDPGILDQGRQRRSGKTIEIVQEALPLKVSYTTAHPEGRRDMESFLNPELNVESDAAPIVRQAAKIAGGVENPVKAARMLLAWVYRNVEKRPVITVPSALEVLRTRIGDCNEHAVLLTALLRASGIPARLCVGLVYARGAFFYHAWTEAFLGKWISMDATLDQMPADATHIKLVEGGLDRQVPIMGLMGKLRLEVLDVRYD
jgi:transglutaminase-like putative cysteine protease